MKYLICFLSIIIFSDTLIAQGNVAVSVAQDLKLAFTEDDYGNQPFTLDTKIKFIMQGKEQKYGWMEMSAQFEYADISTVYKRWAVGISYNFNKFILIDIAPEFNWGWIDRDGTSYSAELSLEISRKLTNNLDFILVNSWTHRTELKDKPWRYNLSGGLQYTFK